MAAAMQFGLVVRGQFHLGNDFQARFAEIVEQARLAEKLGFASITKTSHYSTHPLQSFQQLPVLARLSGETDKLRLNAGVILLSLHKPLDIAEQLATIDIMSGGRVIFGVALGYREEEFRALRLSPTRRRLRNGGRMWHNCFS